MQENRWRQIEEIFNRAAVLPSGERRRFIEDVCREDAELCREVLSLIETDDDAENSFLNEPIFALGAQLLENDFHELLKKEKFADYNLKKLIGRGGMGAVFLAEDTRLKRRVALKILPSSIAEKTDAVARFRQEARAASGVAHQNIAHIYEFNQADGRYFLAMEYVRGRTLREFVREKLIDEASAIDFALQIAAALQSAHKAGIVHRDIKPENVIVTEENLVKVLDFGLAKLMDAAAAEFNETESLDTIPGMIIGTTAYMSPEQVRGQFLDYRTDVWSLGVVLYEMLAGKRPFAGETPSDLQAAILRDGFPSLPPKTKFHKEFSALIEKSLEKDRRTRFETIGDFIAEAKIIKRKFDQNAPAGVWKPRDWFLKAVLPLVLAAAFFFGLSEPLGRYFSNTAKTENSPTESIAGRIESLAVLPFENSPDHPELRFLSEGLAEDLTRNLGSLNRFPVVSYASSRKIKADENHESIKNRLRVSTLLRGKIEPEKAENLSVQIELVNLNDGTVLWREKLTAARSDLLKLRNALASLIVNEFQTLGGFEKKLILTDYGTQNNEAFLKYLEGKYAPDRSTEEGTRRAAGILKQATEIDPDYALAHIALADAYNLLGTWYGHKPEFYQPLAKKTAEKAIALDDSLSEAHTTLAKIKMDYDRDFAGTEQSFRRAIELNPNNSQAHHWYGEVFLSAMKRLDESLRELEIARRLNPLSTGILTALAWTHIGRGEYEKAVALCDEAIALNDRDTGNYSYKAMALMKLARYDEAIAVIEKAYQINESGLVELGVIYGVSGQTEKAREILEKLKQDSDAYYNQAVVYGAIGEKDIAFKLLEKQAAMKNVDLLSIRIDPLLDSLRDDPRFAEIEAKLNLPPQ